jgi:hypothetical protein
MRSVSHDSCRENQNTRFMFSKFFFSENRAVYEIRNVEKYGGAREAAYVNMAVRCMLD